MQFVSALFLEQQSVRVLRSSLVCVDNFVEGDILEAKETEFSMAEKVQILKIGKF